MAETKVDSFMVYVPSESQGDILYRNGSRWTRLPAGTAEWVLTTKGAGQNPVWQAPASADITSWAAYTPSSTQGFGTVSSASFNSRRVGSNLEVIAKFTAGTVSGSEARISIGYNGTSGNVTTNNSGVLPSGVSCLGYASRSSTITGAITVLVEPNVTYVTFGHTSSGGGLTKSQGSNLLNTSDDFSFFVSIPIQGW